MDLLVAEVVERLGRIDTWINNAGVSAYGRIMDLEPAEIERVVGRALS